MHPNKGNNLKLYPMPQTSRSERTPHGLTLYQPPQICSRPADWPIPPTEPPKVKMEKAEVPPRVAAIPHAMFLNKPQNNKAVEEKCTWGLHCPICKREEEDTEDWNSDRQETEI